MAVWFRHIARYAARRIAADPAARETAARVARGAADEVRQIAKSDDRARAAGRAVRRMLDKLQDER